LLVASPMLKQEYFVIKSIKYIFVRSIYDSISAYFHAAFEVIFLCQLRYSDVATCESDSCDVRKNNVFMLNDFNNKYSQFLT
jgi:hypothetical protein